MTIGYQVSIIEPFIRPGCSVGKYNVVCTLQEMVAVTVNLLQCCFKIGPGECGKLRMVVIVQVNAITTQKCRAWRGLVVNGSHQVPVDGQGIISDAKRIDRNGKFMSCQVVSNAICKARPQRNQLLTQFDGLCGRVGF